MRPQRKPPYGNKKRLASDHRTITMENASPMATLERISRLPERQRNEIPGGEWGPFIRGVMEQPNQPVVVQDGLPLHKAKAAYSAFKKVPGMTVTRCSDQAVLDRYGMGLRAVRQAPDARADTRNWPGRNRPRRSVPGSA